MQGHIFAEMADTAAQVALLVERHEGTAFLFECRMKPEKRSIHFRHTFTVEAVLDAL